MIWAAVLSAIAGAFLLGLALHSPHPRQSLRVRRDGRLVLRHYASQRRGDVN